MFPQLTRFADLAILLLRLMVGVVFITSGWNHVKDPEARSKSIGLSKNFTILVGAGEVLGSLGVTFGVLTQLAALGLILIMLDMEDGARFDGPDHSLQNRSPITDCF